MKPALLVFCVLIALVPNVFGEEKVKFSIKISQQKIQKAKQAK